MNPGTPDAVSPVLTIGHSASALPAFVERLQADGVGLLVDVRTVPRSRHNPQFNTDTLPGHLQAAGIAYRHAPGLGGLRRARPDSPNTGWRNASFRGFADYMQTVEFETALQELLALSLTQRIALMCAEAVPWRCHRSLIADALTLRGVAVEHIIGRRRQPHRLTPWARIEGLRITYPPATDTTVPDGGRTT